MAPNLDDLAVTYRPPAEHGGCHHNPVTHCCVIRAKGPKHARIRTFVTHLDDEAKRVDGSARPPVTSSEQGGTKVLTIDDQR